MNVNQFINQVMRSNVSKIVKCEKEEADLLIVSNSTFEIEIFFENEFVDRQYMFPGSRIRFINLTKDDKVVIKSVYSNER